jgi:hypothetical protein
MANNLRAAVFHLDYDVGPTYHCELWIQSWFEPHWAVTTIVYEKEPFHGHREISRQQDVAYRTTMDVGVAQAAQRALYALSNWERARPMDTYYRYTPYKASGEAKTYITPAPVYEGVLSDVRGLLAAINIVLDDTNNTHCSSIEGPRLGYVGACVGGCSIEQGPTGYPQ